MKRELKVINNCLDVKKALAVKNHPKEKTIYCIIKTSPLRSMSVLELIISLCSYPKFQLYFVLCSCGKN